MVRRAVLFDLYNTLLTPDGATMTEVDQDGVAAFEATMVAGGLILVAGEAPNAYADLFSHPANRKRDDGLTIFEGRFRDLAVRNGFDAPVKLIREAALAVVTAWQKHWQLDPAVPGVLEGLRRDSFATGLVTNFDHWPHVHTLLMEHRLTGLFDRVTISGEVLIDKPDPAIFHLTLGRLGVQPQDAVHIGDHDVDVNGAVAAGVIPVRVVRSSLAGGQEPANGPSAGTRGDEARSERVITSFNEVPLVVKELFDGHGS